MYVMVTYSRPALYQKFLTNSYFAHGNAIYTVGLIWHPVSNLHFIAWCYSFISKSGIPVLRKTHKVLDIPSVPCAAWLCEQRISSTSLYSSQSTDIIRNFDIPSFITIIPFAISILSRVSLSGITILHSNLEADKRRDQIINAFKYRFRSRR